uniref:Uncharacterized protein n=1 Tax=Lepeophtheirus salmonis TaxID=72036 RepID=A0A0K2VLD2_LEPSM
MYYSVMKSNITQSNPDQLNKNVLTLKLYKLISLYQCANDLGDRALTKSTSNMPCMYNVSDENRVFFGHVKKTTKINSYLDNF